MQDDRVKNAENWLDIIKKYTQLLEEPEYWQQKAAIDESGCDIATTVECYRTL